jgi:APA family basic amino acid/polyamine antiporter
VTVSEAAAAAHSGVAHPPKTRILGLKTGVGIVVANMIGSGVFVSAGFMAQDLAPLWLLLAWVVGAALAVAGALTYGEIARIIGRSGGEYRYLSDLMHPWLGSLAGWASLLVGFAAAIAFDAFNAGAFLVTLLPGDHGLDPSLVARIVGTGLIVALTAVHAVHLAWSKWAQNILVVAKIGLVLGFVALGLGLGSTAWPTWTPPRAPTDGSFPWSAFLQHQYWVAFTFSGWNAAIYAAGEFRRPQRDVPRAMLIGCTGVAVLYLVVNWVFVANLTPEQAAVVMQDDAQAVTLGHLVVTDLVGPIGGYVMSACAVLLFASALSAMTMVGPRVYAEMAHDGVLPRWLRGRPGRPPTGSILLQGALALLLLYGETILQLVQSAAVVLLIFSGLTAVAVFWIRFRHPDLPRPRPLGLLAAGIYLAAVVVLVAWGIQDSLVVLGTVLIIVVAATTAWLWSRRPPPARLAEAAPPGE